MASHTAREMSFTVWTTVCMAPNVLNAKELAERVGFEPTLPFRVNTLSKRAPSATRPSLRRVKDLQQVPSNQVARLCDSLNGGLCCPVSKHDISSLSGNVSIFTTSAQQPSAGTPMPS